MFRQREAILPRNRIILNTRKRRSLGKRLKDYDSKKLYLHWWKMAVAFIQSKTRRKTIHQSETETVICFSESNLREKQAKKKMICVVCLDAIEVHYEATTNTITSTERPISILVCGHLYHLDCIANTFVLSGDIRCPSCRKMQVGEWKVLKQRYRDSYVEEEARLELEDPQLYYDYPVNNDFGQHIRFRFDEALNAGDANTDTVAELQEAISQDTLRCLTTLATESLSHLQLCRIEKEQQMTNMRESGRDIATAQRISQDVERLSNQEDDTREILNWLREPTRPALAEGATLEKLVVFILKQSKAAQAALDDLQRSARVMYMTSKEYALGARIGRLNSVLYDFATIMRLQI